MLLLVLLMLVILLVAGAIVLYVAYPHRGEEVPGAPWLGEAVRRPVDLVGDLMERPAEAPDPQHAER